MPFFSLIDIAHKTTRPRRSTGSPKNGLPGELRVVPVEKPFEKNRFRDLGESDSVGCVRIDFVKRTGAKWFPRTAPNRRK